VKETALAGVSDRFNRSRTRRRPRPRSSVLLAPAFPRYARGSISENLGVRGVLQRFHVEDEDDDEYEDEEERRGRFCLQGQIITARRAGWPIKDYPRGKGLAPRPILGC
jgi:hypothetical protein